jgi:hypothetical protein
LRLRHPRTRDRECSGACAFQCLRGYEKCGEACCANPSLALGANRACFRKSGTEVFCWGSVMGAGLDGTSNKPPAPVAASALTFPVAELSLGGPAVCSLDDSDAIWCRRGPLRTKAYRLVQGSRASAWWIRCAGSPRAARQSVPSQETDPWSVGGRT